MVAWPVPRVEPACSRASLAPSGFKYCAGPDYGFGPQMPVKVGITWAGLVFLMEPYPSNWAATMTDLR
ncbi:hypothetical protein Droror1_Dr00023159 [Drosera rotundifolia]